MKAREKACSRNRPAFGPIQKYKKDGEKPRRLSNKIAGFVTIQQLKAIAYCIL
jgi:hypothetical protein